MARNLVISMLGLVLAAFAAVEMQAATPSGTGHVTPGQIKALAKQAHTPEQFSILAGYYGQLQNDYLKKAAEEKTEWERRSQIDAGLAQKYPRPTDSAHNLYDYLMYKASEMGTLKTKFAQKAEADTSVAAR